MLSIPSSSLEKRQSINLKRRALSFLSSMQHHCCRVCWGCLACQLEMKSNAIISLRQSFWPTVNFSRKWLRGLWQAFYWNRAFPLWLEATHRGACRGLNSAFGWVEDLKDWLCPSEAASLCSSCTTWLAVLLCCCYSKSAHACLLGAKQHYSAF